MIENRWTPAVVETIKARRAERRPWKEIAAELSIPQYAIVKYAKQNGIGAAPLASLKHSEAFDPNRPSLPPGHEITWNAIIWGTLLHGMRYPIP